MDLFDALTAPKRRSLFCPEGGDLAVAPWDEVVAGAHRTATGLRQRGVGGEAVACVLTNRREVVSGMLGVWLAGGAIASLPILARAMGREEYADQLVALCAHMGSRMLLLEQRLVEALRDPIGGRVELVAWDSLPADGRHEPDPPAPDEPAFIQYSSGSTSAPKGCVLSARAIASQLEMIAAMTSTVPGEDSVASWLPLSHDMGAFGCLLFPWAHDLDLVLSSPQRFIHDPRTWFGDCAEFGATLSAGPPSALQVAARAQRTQPLRKPLRLRTCVVGGERIAWSALESASAALAPFGMAAKGWMPAYGMAEATLIVTGVDADEEPRARWIDSAALAEEEVRHRDGGGEGATPIISLGRPRAGVELRLEDPDRLSEIHLRSPSLASGYHREPARTAARFRDGELASGDLGFIEDGELYVVGRCDDMLSVAGRNVYAGEVESAVDLFDAVRSGCSTLIDVGRESRSSLVMLLELKDEQADFRRLAAAASSTAKEKAGVLLDECIFLARGALPKTPSGKIQRFRCRHLIATEALDPLERVRLRQGVR